MQKTKLGISVGLLGAGICFLGIFSGMLIMSLLVVYVLWVEENEWLRRTAVKAIVLMVAFSFLTAVLSLVPEAITMVNNVVAVFGGKFTLSWVNKVFLALETVVSYLQKIVFLGFGLKALNQGTIVIPVIDNFVSRHI